MKQLSLFLATGLMCLLVSANCYSAVKKIKCGDLTGVEITVTMTGATVPGVDSAAAMAQYGQRLANKAESSGKIKCKIEECDEDKLPQSCKPKFISYVDPAPTPTDNGDSTWSFPPTTIKFMVSCSDCVYPPLAIAMIMDPADGTLAACDGMMHFVTIDMTGVTIMDINGLPITLDEARERWLDLIVHDNGNNFVGSEPWGCMMSQCIGEGFEGGCEMTIHTAESQPVPFPDPDPETGGWTFEPTPFMMAYSCSSCGEQSGEPPLRLSGTAYGIEKADDSDGLIENLYPNPSSDQLTLVLNLKVDGAQISVLDISGKQLKSYSVPVSNVNRGLISIDVSDLPAGIYQLSVTSGDQVTSRKFSVNR